MNELFKNLGINWHVLLTQIVNFTILLFILQRFLYKPIIGMLNKRREEIETTHENAKMVSVRLSEIDREKEAALSKARRDSEALIKQAEANAGKAAERIIVETKEEVSRLNKEERSKIYKEREKLIQEATRHLGETVAGAVEKSIGDVLDEKAKAKLVEQALKVAESKLS